VYPARTDPVETLSASYRNIIFAQKLLDRFGREKLRQMTKERNAMGVFDGLQAMMIGE
jgi:hypothetical protein